MSDTEETPTDAQELYTAFEQLGARPKARTPKELVDWMRTYVAQRPEPELVSAEGFSSTATHQSPDEDHSSRKQVLSHQVRLPTFSGDGKGDATIDLWKYEVECLQREKYSADVVHQAIRRSLKGEAARIAMRLGPKATTKDLIEKLESVYGEVEQPELLFAKFFSARQQKDEDVAAWGCRLEDLHTKALREAPAEAKDSSDSLRVMFWSGLCDDLKDITMHLYESINDFDKLRVAVRRVEQDHKRRRQEEQTLASSSSKKTTPCKSATENPQLQEIHGLIQQLTAEVQALRTDQQNLNARLDTYAPYQSGNYGNNPPQARPYQPRGNSRKQRNSKGPQNNNNRQATANREQKHPEATACDADSDIVCWNCGQVGHIAIGCRIRTDFRRRHLNSPRPMPRGGQ